MIFLYFSHSSNYFLRTKNKYKIQKNNELQKFLPYHRKVIFRKVDMIFFENQTLIFILRSYFYKNIYVV